MSNVKPGDLAKVVVDPDNQGFLGAQVHIEGLPDAFERSLVAPHLRHMLYWACTLLETRKGHDGFKYDQLLKAGKRICIPDLFLKRIDPPADNEQLYSTEPMEGESLKEYEDAKTS